jgi:hypothetical protein
VRAAGKEMSQTSSDVTRTLPTNLSPEAERNAGGSLIAVKKVLTRRAGHKTSRHTVAMLVHTSTAVANEVTPSVSVDDYRVISGRSVFR